MKITNNPKTVRQYQLMQKITDCGVEVLSYTANIPRDLAMVALGYKGRDDYRDDIGTDTHWNHFATLDKLGIQWIKFSEDIPPEKLINERTALCLKLSTTNYHWVVLKKISIEFTQYNDPVPYINLVCAMGNGRYGSFTIKDVFAGYIIPLPDEREYDEKELSHASMFDRFMSAILRWVA